MKLLLLFGASFLMLLTSFGQVRLPRLIRDSMVLQRDTKLKIWGWAAPKEKVEVIFQGKSFATKTNSDGEWIVMLPPMPAGGPYAMSINASNHLEIKNILMGDVWLCSGQSNMEHQVALHEEYYRNELLNVDYPMIRQFLVPKVTELQNPRYDLQDGSWVAADNKSVLNFSAVAYFFAKSLFDKSKVPIGIINASWGGTPIEAWIAESGLKEFPSFQATLEKNKDTAFVNGTNRAASLFNDSKPKPLDMGMNTAIPWYSNAYKPERWHNITVPGYWEDQGQKNLHGIVWYRKELEIPATMVGKSAKIALGRIVDADGVYLNGRQIGITYYQYPQRRYQIPSNLLHAGKNTLVVRVTNFSGKGGFVPDKPYYIATSEDTLRLNGDWQFKVGCVFTAQKSGINSISIQNQPTALYNSMIAPLTNYGIKGAVWYQGESNVGNNQYDKLLSELIENWREVFQQKNLPFLFVQLPNFSDVQFSPYESAWAALRNCQFKTLSVPNTAMAVTIDLGEWNDIHPNRKKDVGDRLALAARKLVYGENGLIASGPLFQSNEIKEDKINISFSNIGSGLTINGSGELSEFAIAGSDKVFVWAKAKIESDKVIVWSDEVAKPKYVRYAWSDNPDNPNLYNKEGLPASPFTTEK